MFCDHLYINSHPEGSMATSLKKILIFSIILMPMVIGNTMARPGRFEEFGNPFHENRCKLNDQRVIEVCQRCAKQTKSPIVYPMCCENLEDAFNWCDKYINYGKKS